MITRYALLIIVLLCNLGPNQTFGQAQELEQLSLDITKLLQFKQILSDMKAGYDILTKGYETIRGVAQGNFDLHKTFLDGLLEASPTVLQYKRIAQIVDMQLQLVKTYKAAASNFSASGLLYSEELEYVSQVYHQLFTRSLDNISDLTLVITAGRLRMSDDERLGEIDWIYSDQRDQLNFLKLFNNKTSVLLLQRAKEKNDVESNYYWYDK